MPSYYHTLGHRLNHSAAGASVPWSGLLSIALALGCGVAALVIGLVSKGQQLDAWTIAGGYEVQPSVLLAIAATVANALLAYAFAEGVALSWWAKAQRGTTLQSLHAAYEQSSSLAGLFTSLPHFGRVAIASLAMLILLMDGPLLQRASTIQTSEEVTTTNMSIPISPFPLMNGATGVIGDHSAPDSPDLYHPMFAQVVQQYNNRDPIVLSNTTCSGRCETEIVAPGWDISCANGSFPYRLPSAIEWVTWSINPKNYTGPKIEQTMFETNVTLQWAYWNSTTDATDADYAGLYTLSLYSMWKATAGGNGTMNWRNCTLSEALVRYPIRMDNDTVTLQPMPTTKNRTVHEVYRNYNSEGIGNYPSTLGGFWLALNNQYATQANVTGPKPQYRVDTTNAVANSYISSNVSVQDLGTANITWTDPIDDMIATIQELSFRTGIAFTNQVPYPTNWFGDNATLTEALPEVAYPNLTMVNRTLSQNVSATMSQPKTVYHTRDGWLAGGFIVIALACVALLPTYWGWWRLHVKPSMCPLAIARAFDAPLLRDIESHHEAGVLRVQFGDHGIGVIGEKPMGEVMESQEGFTKPGMARVAEGYGDPHSVPYYGEGGVSTGRVMTFRRIGESSSRS